MGWEVGVVGMGWEVWVRYKISMGYELVVKRRYRLGMACGKYVVGLDFSTLVLTKLSF